MNPLLQTLNGLISWSRFPVQIRRTAAGFALFVVGIVVNSAPVEAQVDSSAAKGEWKIEIRPLDSTAAVSGAGTTGASKPGADASVTAASGALSPRMSYDEAYRSIPFSRAEYEANPGYRHDAALELMFGALRPTTVVRQNTPYFSRYPDFFRNRFQVFPYPYSHSPALNMYYLWSTNAITY
jgi:hypothetical protein